MKTTLHIILSIKKIMNSNVYVVIIKLHYNKQMEHCNNK